MLRLLALTAVVAFTAGCASDEPPETSPRTGPPTVSGLPLLPMPGERERECRKFASAGGVTCPAVFPRPPYSGHDGGWAIKPVRAVWRREHWTGVDISYLSSPPRDEDPLTLHFTIEAPAPGVRAGYGSVIAAAGQRATLAGHRGRYTKAKNEWPCCNHDVFAWREGGRRYVASMHRIGPQTKRVLATLLRRTELPAS